MAAPQFDAAFVSVAGTTTLSVTVAANNNRVLYVNVDTDTAPTSVTRDGQSFTAVSGDNFVWRLIAPNTGTANVTIAGSVGTIYALSALSLYDANQTTPERTTASLLTPITAPWTFAVTSATDDLVIDMGTVLGSAFSTTESGQTERIDTQLAGGNAGYRALASTRVATSTSTNMSWTGIGIAAGYMYLLAVRAAPARRSEARIVSVPTTNAKTFFTISQTQIGKLVVGSQ